MWLACYAGCQNTKLTPLLDGAPNFRQVEGLPVYGVAIPTVRGLRNVMDVLGAAQGQCTDTACAQTQTAAGCRHCRLCIKSMRMIIMNEQLVLQ
jgi:uncharacterized protein YrrD